MNDFLQSLRNGQAEKPRTPKTRKNHDNSYHYTSAPRFHSYGGYQNTRSQQMKRPPIQHQQQHGNQMPPADELSTSTMLAEAIENLNSHIETLANNQDHLASVQAKTADMLERQAIAIERILDHLQIGADQKAAPKQQKVEPKQQKPAPKQQKAAPVKKTFKHHYVTSQKSEPAIKEPVQAEAIAPEPVKPAKSVIRKRKGVVTRKPVESVKPDTDTTLLGRDKIMNIIQTMRAEGATFDQVASRLVDLGQPTFSGRGEWHAQTIHRLCNKK